MSTITVAKKGGRVAIAADTLTSWGPNRESADYVVSHDKILRTGSNYIGVCGAASGKLALQNYLASLEGPPDLRTVDSIYAFALGWHSALKERYFVLPHEDHDDSFESSRVDLLIANPSGIFGLAAQRAVQEFAKFYAFGVGCDFALGAMFVAFSNPSTSAEDVARAGVDAAAEFNSKTGRPIIAFSVTLDA